jgi:putative endonuclease
MKPIGMHNYHTYILTNIKKNVLYTGVTNDLGRHLLEHVEDSRTFRKHFTGRYNCIYLIYYEWFENVQDAIDREKEIKGWTRVKKIELINTYNEQWEFLNYQFEDMY